MAPVVFTCCWIFIAVLLVRDSRRRPHLSLATWISTAMVVVLFSRTPMSWFSPTRSDVPGIDSSDEFGNLLDQSFFAVTIGVSLLITLMRRVNWRSLVSQNKALTLFYLYFLVSILWSQVPQYSLIRIVKDFGCTVGVLAVILSESRPLEALRAVYVRCACILIPLSAVLVRFSSLGKGYANDGGVVYGGACGNKNEFGEMLYIAILFLLWESFESSDAQGKKFWQKLTIDRAVLIFMGLYLLNLSQSRTSLVALGVGSFLLFRWRWLNSRLTSRAIFITAALYPVLALTGQTIFAPVLEMLGRDVTFTGRANIWKHITLHTVNPVIGAGYWNFWAGPGGRAIEAAMQTGIPNAHDGYLDMYLDGGVLGVLILTVLLLSRGSTLLRRMPGDHYARFQFALLVVAIMHNVTESSFARLSGMWFTIVLALIDFPGVMKKLKTATGTIKNPAFAQVG